MEKKLISVIVPIYNVQMYLNECIDSIINQVYDKLEIILVDDGSPDDCGKICDEYAKKDARIKVIHKSNGGLSSARNAGLEAASGEYIAFIDSDDYISEKYFERLYNLCVKYNADIAECDFIRFRENIERAEIKIDINKYSNIEMLDRIYSKDGIRTIIVCNKLYKKDIYEDLRFPVGKINEDEYITYKAIDKAKKIVATNEVLYYYRQNDKSIMGQEFNIKRLDVIEAIEERLAYYKSKNYLSLYEKTIIKFQEILKNMYLLTKKHIKNSDVYLKEIYKKIKTNYLEYKKISKVSFAEKFQMTFFVKFPELYYVLTKIKDKLRNI